MVKKLIYILQEVYLCHPIKVYPFWYCFFLTCLLSTRLIASSTQSDQTSHTTNHSDIFYIDYVKTDGKYFDVNVSTFSPTDDKTLLQQYFFTNLKKNKDKPGGLIEVIDTNVNDLLKSDKKENADLVLKWLDLEETKTVLQRKASLICKAYCLSRKLSSKTDRLDPVDDEVVTLISIIDSSQKTLAHQPGLHWFRHWQFKLCKTVK